MSTKHHTILIVALACALIYSFLRGCEPEATWLIAPNDPNRTAVAEGYAVWSGLLLFAEKNGGRYPKSLDMLKPEYIGEDIDIAAFQLRASGVPKTWKDLLATRKIATTNGVLVISVYGCGVWVGPED